MQAIRPAPERLGRALKASSEFEWKESLGVRCGSAWLHLLRVDEMLDTPEAAVENIRILSLRDIPEGTKYA